MAGDTTQIQANQNLNPSLSDINNRLAKIESALLGDPLNNKPGFCQHVIDLTMTVYGTTNCRGIEKKVEDLEDAERERKIERRVTLAWAGALATTISVVGSWVAKLLWGK